MIARPPTDNDEGGKLCPCCSGRTYGACCRPFHRGELPKTAEQLMRSRYSAYALCLPEYIMQTTHPRGPHFQHDKKRWSREITAFCLHTRFERLEVLDAQAGDGVAMVTFIAHLIQDNKDASFQERSFFEKVDGRWLYHSGQYPGQ